MSNIANRLLRQTVLATVIITSIGSPAVFSADEREVRETARVELEAALQLSGDPERGRSLFATCAACHGGDGAGQSDGNAPVIARQHRSVVLKQLVDYRHALRWDLRMEHVVELKKFESLQDLADVAVYVSQLPRVDQVGYGPGEHLQRGSWTFILQCASCHGASGDGSSTARIPRLAAQHYDYLRRQLWDIAEGRRPQLSATHDKWLSDLEQTDVNGIADYLSRVVPR